MTAVNIKEVLNATEATGEINWEITNPDKKFSFSKVAYSSAPGGVVIGGEGGESELVFMTLPHDFNGKTLQLGSAVGPNTAVMYVADGISADLVISGTLKATYDSGQKKVIGAFDGVLLLNRLRKVKGAFNVTHD